MHYKYLLDIALILIATKVLGIFAQRLKMPQVVGALVAGLLLGPACLGFVQETDFLKTSASLGVIVLMFTSGLETDFNELKNSSKASVIIALAGVLIPLAGGYLVGLYFNNPAMLTGEPIAAPLMLQNIFLGVILTATSVSITVETLREMGKLRGAVGSAILGAAIIDDVLGIIALTIITSFADHSVNVAVVLIKIVLFFVFAVVVGMFFAKFYREWTCKTTENRPQHAIVAFVFCLAFSFIAEEFFGVTDITGAFLAGLLLSNINSTKRSQYLGTCFGTLSFMYLSPIFFADIGLQVVISDMSTHILLFAVVLTIVAVFSKMFGCGAGAKVMGFKSKESLQIGVGMVSRGEVALIVASKGSALGLIREEFFGPVIVVVVVTTIITPILLKIAFQDSTRPTIAPPLPEEDDSPDVPADVPVSAEKDNN